MHLIIYISIFPAGSSSQTATRDFRLPSPSLRRSARTTTRMALFQPTGTKRPGDDPSDAPPPKKTA